MEHSTKLDKCAPEHHCEVCEKRTRVSKEYTQKEVQAKFLEHCWAMVNYWKGVGDWQDRLLEGLMHSFLVMLDGGAAELPAFTVIPTPHPNDKAYHIERGEDYFRPFKMTPGRYPFIDVHGSSQLHELMYDFAPLRKEIKEKIEVSSLAKI